MSLGISREGQTVFARMMGSQIWHQGDRGVWEGFRKGTMASAYLDIRYFSFSLYTTSAIQVATLVPEFRGSESER